MPTRNYRVDEYHAESCDQLRMAKLDDSFRVRLRDDSTPPAPPVMAICTLKQIGRESLFVFHATEPGGGSFSYCEWKEAVLRSIDWTRLNALTSAAPAKR
jgi:hypothetical protein